MAQKESALFAASPGSLSGLAAIFLLLAAFFALLNGHKVRALRAEAATPRAPVPAKVNAATGGAIGAQQKAETADTEDRAAKTEAALAQAEKEKADLKGKLDASQQELQRYANARRECKRTRIRPRPAPRRQPTMRRAPIYNRKSMTFGVSSMALRKKKRC